jgi:hypothetical protein
MCILQSYPYLHTVGSLQNSLPESITQQAPTF